MEDANEEINSRVKGVDTNTCRTNNQNDDKAMDSPLLSSNESEDDSCLKNVKKRIKKILDSDEDSNYSTSGLKIFTNNDDETVHILSNKTPSSDDESGDTNIYKLKSRKSRMSRIQNMTSSEEDNCSSKEENMTSSFTIKNTEQQSRMKNKTNKLKNKFNDLAKSCVKHNVKSDLENSNDASISDDKSSKSSSEDELSSIEKIKQKIKERNVKLKSTIYDPDTSDEDVTSRQEMPKAKKKSRKMTSPKPKQMTAKEAMVNMQKIRSESNRMLREKEVSLPYHRPKALLLKDILNRRKPIVSSDGKALPLKMNDEQLQLYAQLLEQRQKEMLELCKSDTEDEETPDNDTVCDNDKKIENCKTLDDKIEFNNYAQDTDYISQSDKVENNSTESISSKNKFGEKSTCTDSIVNDINNESIITSNRDSLDPDNKDEKLKETEAHENDLSFDNLVEANNAELENKTIEKNTFNTEPDSQLISLHYDSEKVVNTNSDLDQNHSNDHGFSIDTVKKVIFKEVDLIKESNASYQNNEPDEKNNSFSDNDIDMEDIDRIIENSDVMENQTIDSPMLIKDAKPKLTGAPGMVIDLDGKDATQSKKISGVELLKQRFTFFNQLKTAKEIQQATQQKIKPGTQHLKLKQELEEQMAEQRSLEWAKRLEEEKLQRQEMNALRGDETDEEDDIDKIEAKLAESDNHGIQDNEVSTESEPEENDVVLEDKSRKKSKFVTDEAEESDCDDNNQEQETGDVIDDDDDGVQNEADNELEDESSDGDSTDDDSTDDDDDDKINIKKKQIKGRILKAFEDSDEERDFIDTTNCHVDGIKKGGDDQITGKTSSNIDGQNSQDEELQSAQLQKSFSEDLFTSQDSDMKSTNTTELTVCETVKVNKLSNSKFADVAEKKIDANLAVICETQAYDDAKFDDIAGMCSGSFSQNVISTQNQIAAQTQDIGDDVLDLCTGKFYDNEFISQQKANLSPEVSSRVEMQKNAENVEKHLVPTNDENKQEKVDDGTLLKSILLELDNPDFAETLPNKFFIDNNDKEQCINQQKKRLVIESDDEAEKSMLEDIKKKHNKRKKLQDRALQISDDEEEELSAEEFVDDIASDLEEDTERLVEYDSEENEVVIQQPQNKKVKRKMADFFEQEAELTSEDEWVGSGDEDEAGLDRMEREAGDDDHFHQGKLQRELGQIHMRDVLDQDKREVRLIQELLFEDGDLGDGHRQRKFRWKNADGVDVASGAGNDLINTQEDELESEEQWRKQRHERETFLRQMQKEGDENEPLNISLNRTAIIKANLSSRTMSSLLMEVNPPKENKLDNTAEIVKKPANDILSPTKKAFPTLQHNYRGSLLSRGAGALARLAAIATPLAGDGSDVAPKLGALKSGKGNFVFAAVSPAPGATKVNKRKKDSNIGTPQLMKKLKTDEKRDLSKKSLLDHLSV